MANSIDSCEGTGSTSAGISRLVIAVKKFFDPYQGVTNEASDALTYFFEERGIDGMGSTSTCLFTAISFFIQGDIPEGFEKFLVEAFDLMFGWTGSVQFVPLIFSLRDDEASTLDKAKVVKIEDFARAIHDTLGMMADVETNEDGS